MKPSATFVIASRPTAGESAFTFNVPLVEKNAATLAGF